MFSHLNNCKKKNHKIHLEMFRLISSLFVGLLINQMNNHGGFSLIESHLKQDDEGMIKSVLRSVKMNFIHAQLQLSLCLRLSEGFLCSCPANVEYFVQCLQF